MGQPIFLIGVPRSGTTLLRVLFDSHPNIVCGPESPWLARGARSIKDLYNYMRDDPFGFAVNFGISNEELRNVFASFIDEAFNTYARKHNKSRWAEKTPDHSLEISFLSEIFPHAYFVHIVRDGRDVACSTSILSKERKIISEWHTNNLLMDNGIVVQNTLQNAAVRWQKWVNKIEFDLRSVKNSISIRYEDLVDQPDQILRNLMKFVGEEYSPVMLDFIKSPHDFPTWEWGSRDVRRSNKICDRSVMRWQKQLDKQAISELNILIGDTLIKYNYV